MIGWDDIIRAYFLELQSRDVVSVWIYCHRAVSTGTQREEKCAMTLEFPFPA